MKLINLAFSLVAALGSTVAFAQTIGFEDVTNVTNPIGSFSSEGFNFVANGGLVTNNQEYCGPSCPGNGTKMLLTREGTSSTGNTTVIMTKIGGGTFALSSFDGAGSFAYSDPLKIPQYIDVLGQLVNGGTVTKTFEIDKGLYSGGFLGLGVLHFTNYTFTGFSNLTSATFSAIGADVQTNNGFTLDNIVATPVPEPESYAMMLVGFGLIGTVIRQRKSLQA
jgi:hypothetical protein